MEFHGRHARLRLRHVDDGARHAADEYHAAWRLAPHKVLGDSDGEEIRAIDIDSPELAHAVNRIADGIEILSEASRGDEVVDLAMRTDYFSNAGFDGDGVRDVSVVGGDFGNSDALLDTSCSVNTIN